MNVQNEVLKAIFNRDKNAPTKNLGAILAKYLYHWPLYVVGFILFFTVAFMYVKTLKPIYEVKASILIKDEKKEPDQRSALHELDLVNSSKIVENEIEILSSKQIISKVVADLQLWVQYQKKDGWVYQDLYESSPVKVTVLKFNTAPAPEKITIAVKDSKSFFLTLPGSKPKEVAFGDKIQTGFGTLKLDPTATCLQYKDITINILLNDPEIVALNYQKMIGVDLSNKLASTVELSINDQVQQRGKDILNSLIYNYNLAATTEKKHETKSTIDFIDARLASLTGELTNAEKGIETFKSSKGLTDISSESKFNLDNMQANNINLNAAKVQLGIVQGIEKYINSANNSQEVPSTQGISDLALSSLVMKFSELQLQREKLLATTPETNPDFEPINRQIATTRAAIKENVKSLKNSLQNTLGSLQSFNNKLESSIRDIPTQERQYISMKRQQTIKEDLYTYLLQKREEVSVSYAATLTGDRIVDQAYSSPAKFPQKTMGYMLAIFLSLGLPTGLIFLRDKIGAKVTDLQEIKDMVEIPIIAELSFHSPEKLIAMNDHKATVIRDQFRALRTRLFDLYEEKQSGKVTLITSSVLDEGKTFVSSNLSLSLANSGKKTIVLELDLHKPELAEIFGLAKANPGISDFLKGTATITDIIQNSGKNPDLDIIGGGTAIQNPFELLEKNEFKELILHLSNIYDEIIIDSPPVHLVPDAMILARFADLTLYMVRQGVTGKVELKYIKELFNKKLFPKINIIFNGIDRIKYGYGYNYEKYDYHEKKEPFLHFILSNLSSRF